MDQCTLPNPHADTTRGTPNPGVLNKKDDSAEWWQGLVIAFAVSVTYAAFYLKRGWIPVDDGTLAMSALRVFRGQLPHADFPEVYTGGMSFYHALAFRILGPNLVAMRYAVFAIFVPWVAVVYWLASRFSSWLAAAGLTVLCAVWSLPAYPAAMPSWYNLFLATFGAAALLKFLDSERRNWLFAAGICAGLSIDVKVIGLYFVAAALLWFVYREQTQNEIAPARASHEPNFFGLFTSASLIAFLACLGLLIRGRMGNGEVWHFFIPAASLALVLIYREWSRAYSVNATRFSSFLRMVVPFAAGIVLLIALDLLPYLRAGSVLPLIHGIAAGGASRIVDLAKFHPENFWYSAFAIPPAALIGISLWRKREIWSVYYGVIALLLGGLVVGARFSAVVGLFTWISAGTAMPVVAIAGAVLFANERFVPHLSVTRKQELFLLVAVAALCSLVQFPFPAPIYFHYFAPLMFLAVAALVSARNRHACDPLLAMLVGFYALIAIVFAVPATLYSPELDLVDRRAPFDLPAAHGLRIVQPEIYVTVANTVNAHARGGRILAFPECPEVYFLSGRDNATANDNIAQLPEALDVIRRGEIYVVVLNSKPFFPAALPSREVVQAVVDRFPNSLVIDKYQVRWR